MVPVSDTSINSTHTVHVYSSETLHHYGHFRPGHLQSESLSEVRAEDRVVLMERNLIPKVPVLRILLHQHLWSPSEYRRRLKDYASAISNIWSTVLKHKARSCETTRPSTSCIQYYSKREAKGEAPSSNYQARRLKRAQDPTELDHITKLPNGIRIATESLPGPFSGIGVYLDAGSRYEDEELRGVSHIVDRLAFKVGIPTPEKNRMG